jgi:hypothetical protein
VRTEVWPQQLQSGRQRSLARDAEVGRSTRHPDIKEPAIEIRETLGEPVGTDKEYCLELKTLDVLHVKDTHLALVSGVGGAGYYGHWSDEALAVRRSARGRIGRGGQRAGGSARRGVQAAFLLFRGVLIA